MDGPRIKHWRFLGLISLVGLIAPWFSFAQTSDQWPTEHLWARDGRHLQGLLLSHSKTRYEFAEILRPRGKPAYTVIRTLPVDRVLKYESLDTVARAQLNDRFLAIRNRAGIEAQRVEDLYLGAATHEGTTYLLYDGPWFTLYSTMDDAITRRCIVRIEQAFGAYRQLLPPRITQQSAFQIYLFGTVREYRAAQARGGWDIAHPAFYDADRNLVMAGTDIAPFAAAWQETTADHERLRSQFKSYAPTFEQSLGQTAAEMKRNGFNADEVENEIRLRRAKWNEQQKQIEQQITQAEQKNAEKFASVTAAMFRRLNHEAFHAYVENYAFPRRDFDMPRWLNEGLAQVFEHAQIDADVLRVDAAPPDLLKRLQTDLRGAQPLSLRDLMQNDDALLAGHLGKQGTAQHYLYAWGLAYYVAFLNATWTNQELEKFVARDAPASATSRLETMMKTSLDRFEPRWREAMLQLK